MLKRIYVHNYKCLVNFEINFDKDISLLLGANGSGKTTVLTALYEIQQFIFLNVQLVDHHRANYKNTVFKPSTLTRWGQDQVQKFEIEIDGNDGVYKYVLEIEHQIERNLARVKTENLFFDDQPLYKFCIEEESGIQVGKGRLFNDGKNNNDGIFYATGWSNSGLGTVQERYDNKKLTWFKKWLARLFIVRITPSAMETDMEMESPYPKLDLSNYVAWLNYWNNENSEGVFSVVSELKEIIKGFSSFRFSQAGTDNKRLEFKINSLFYRFDELSDGQKTLAALYTLIYCVPENSVICIDEPENFLALPEIQPWFDKLYDQCTERNIQVLLISHHPKIINFLANDSGYWFSRENNLTRVQKITSENDSGLAMSELIERGWVDEL